MKREKFKIWKDGETERWHLSEPQLAGYEYKYRSYRGAVEMFDFLRRRYYGADSINGATT